ncbi:MAG: metal ABC transporter permease [Ruminococcaceae bacterium]|nr:metal ABC transporter permease [Oscillospiraceae bacterium]
MIEYILSFLQYDFMRNALIVGLLIAVCCALLGVSLVLKRFSMIGDGLSHVGFGASALALALGFAPLYVAIPTVIIAAFLMLRINKNSKINGDAIIALVSSSALAIGYTAQKLSGGGNIDISNYMFGSIYTVSKEDVIITVILSVLVLALYVVFYNKLFAITFDEDFAAATGVKTGAYNSLLAALTAVTVVIGMRMMGALLISSLIIFPVLTASRLCKNYRSVIISSLIISVFNFLTGLVLSIVLNTSPGSSVVIVSLAVFVILSVVGRIFKK